MLRTYRTPKGTDLPLLNLRGKEYLEVKYRLVWFREEHANWAIETELLSVTDQSAYARATVKDEQGRVIATSHKFETRQGFPDFIEKAETGAIGRALALIGYGTQFCADELDEGPRIVDAPVARSRTPAKAMGTKIVREEDQIPSSLKVEPREAASPSASARANPGDYTVSFGKKYKGQKLRDIPRAELEGYLEWLDESAQKNGQPLSDEARHLKLAAGRFLQVAARVATR
jgi:hypothetical protein